MVGHELPLGVLWSPGIDLKAFLVRLRILLVVFNMADHVVPELPTPRVPAWILYGPTAVGTMLSSIARQLLQLRESVLFHDAHYGTALEDLDGLARRYVSLVLSLKPAPGT